MLQRWHLQPHVLEWWDDYDHDTAIREYTSEFGSSVIERFIVDYEGRPFGFLQTYDAFRAGDGWWPDEPVGTWGIDCFIGEAALLGKGLGSAMVRQMAQSLLARPGVTRLIIDPAPKNLRASMRLREPEEIERPTMSL